MTPMPTVAVIGAGIAGMSAAHELALLGYRVSVYEATGEAGGFFRSARLPRDGGLPSEYSWHGFGPWYHNTFGIMKQIPFDDRGSVYDRALSRPIDFGIFPDHGVAAFYDSGLTSIPWMFHMSRWEWARWSWLMLKTWAAHDRTEEHYSRLNGAEQWRHLIGPRAYQAWRSCFGPWIGSDWPNVSLHHVGQFFRKQLISRPSHRHEGDEEGPPWSHGAGDGWLLLRGPSSEYWFDPWTRHLGEHGVNFFWHQSLHSLDFDGENVTKAHMESGLEVKADFFVLAVTPFAAAELLARTPLLEAERELRLFKPLTQDGPHTQVSFRIAFSEPVSFPRKRTAVIVADSEFNLTLFAQEQAWRPEVELAKGVRSLWTGTSCVGTVPGRIHGLPVAQCTREQFLEEVKAQILSCESLDAMIREANDGRGLRDLEILRMEAWHEWTFSAEGITPLQPKWVTTTSTQPYLPRQSTSIPNLLLAGAHTRTEADVWSIEGAVESGRRAAQGIDPRVSVVGQYKPRWLKVIGRLDDVCFGLGAPHALDLALAGVLTLTTALGWHLLPHLPW